MSLPFPNKNTSSQTVKEDDVDDGKPSLEPELEQMSIDANCSSYKLILPPEYYIRKASIEAQRQREANEVNEDTVAALNPATWKTPPHSTTSGDKSRGGGIKLTRMSRKKSTEVLGGVLESLNLNTPKNFKEPAVKRQLRSSKRKRLEDDISAENIPFEKVLPPIPSGVNKDVSPQKRRRLHPLISPNTPLSPLPEEAGSRSRFRIPRKY